MSDLAKAFFSGMLAEEPKSRYTAQGAPMVEIHLDQTLDRPGPQGKGQVQVHQITPITFWGQRAEAILAQGLAVGTYMVIEASVTVRVAKSRQGGEFPNVHLNGFTWQVIGA